jgi:iron complex outermembrane receptor protein
LSFSQNRITGYITDKSTNVKLPNVSIYINDLQKGTTSNSDGLYSLENIPNGFFKIQFSYLGYSTVIKTINLKSDVLELNISLVPTSVKTPEIIISGGQPVSQHENAIKIESIKKEALENEGGGNIMKKLNAIPGIDAISKGNNIATPVIRGLSTSNIIVLNNGIRMESFQFSEDHPYTIDESDVSNIEIIKGPASLLYGSDAVGGVINFIKDPPAPVNTTKKKAETKKKKELY